MASIDFAVVGQRQFVAYGWILILFFAAHHEGLCDVSLSYLVFFCRNRNKVKEFGSVGLTLHYGIRILCVFQFLYM